MPTTTAQPGGFFDTLKDAFRLRQRNRLLTAAELVERVADGTLDTDTALSQLEAIGWTPHELQERVAVRQQRLQDAEAIRAAAEAKKDGPRVDAAIDEAGRKRAEAIQAANEEYRRTVAPLEARRVEIDHLGHAAGTARHRLLETCDPLLKEQIDAALARYQEANRHASVLRENIVQAEITAKRFAKQLESTRRNARVLPKEDREAVDVAGAEQSAKNADARVKDLNKQLAAAIKQRDALSAELDELRQKQLEA